MPFPSSNAHPKSARRREFECYIRTGRRPSDWSGNVGLGFKFNPYHDPRNGQFTFAPGDPRALHHVITSDRRVSRIPELTAHATVAGRVTGNAPIVGEPNALGSNGNFPKLQPAMFRSNPRVRTGSNGGPPLNDPLTLVTIFPGISSTPAAGLVAIADNILDLTGPAQTLTTELTEAHVNQLILQIRALDPNYHLDSFGFPRTLKGQINLIQVLRSERAAVVFRTKGDARPLQVETLRVMQRRADIAYEEAVQLYRAGRLKTKLSREEAIGNFVDRAVRRDLREYYQRSGIDISKGPVRVVGREYDSSGNELTFRIPDARVGRIAFDVTLARKTASTPQVRGFFAADFQPTTVIIIRPSQLGQGSTYAIPRQRK